MRQSIISSIKRNGKYALGLIIASAIGGATVAAVQAAIPDSSGNINACYKGTKTFYVTDPAGNCKASETALSWDRGAQAYASITDGGGGTAVIDPANSAHIASATIPPLDTILCLTFDSTVVAPKQILITKEHPHGDVPGANLASVGGFDFSRCPAGTDAVVDGGDGGVPVPVFVRVY